MLALYEDPKYENTQTCHLLTALEVAVEIEKRKINVAPNDSVGIILFNTVRISLRPLISDEPTLTSESET